MKPLASTLLLAAALALPHALSAETGTWQIDPAHSSVEFAVRHMMISDVNGRFEKFSGSVIGDPAKPETAKVSVSIDPASIDTGSAGRDDDLRGDNFFDVAKYPEMTFVSTKVSRGRDGKLQVLGNLTMHGVTRVVALSVVEMSSVIRDAKGNSRVGVRASTEIDRQDWGIRWSRTIDGGGLIASNEVRITLALELVKAAQGK